MGIGTMRNFISTALLATAATACAGSPLSDPKPEPVPLYAGPWAGAGVDMEAVSEPNPSLWATSPNALLSMRRAKAVGDLLTVVVEMNDQANLKSSLSRSQGSSEDLGIDALLGLPDVLNNALPGSASVSPAIDFKRNSNMAGNGAVNRAEQVTFTLAARVVGVEPNGNLIIQGYQQTRVSNEIRYLSVSGVIRAQDITRTNTVTYDKIADAQLSYVNQGDTTGLNGRKAVPKLLDKVLPF
ncbi:flagellar basal body L-ring protein FlgH [Hyphomonas sp.]|jgi:flagellar L-ring protein precursor FlgH|uniref:flagellar basal body L-ring protein FlgH n=1 Tax=Hyphomonas sp. TaxID=87 RepID=UPI000C423B40|nr:flagellar basal body L-ring protein FlgH [Hyphomonas sp.]MAB12252.1 flagellar biosynthesis protein FlgH [Hyphomonas sp.]MAU68625.1 flagellar biosynthesis protein FlgH [Hyphomonas sp.]MBM59770.1 flagellar biosynthesis protein FlgH [Hyphomonas sp.]